MYAHGRISLSAFRPAMYRDACMFWLLYYCCCTKFHLAMRRDACMFRVPYCDYYSEFRLEQHCLKVANQKMCVTPSSREKRKNDPPCYNPLLSKQLQVRREVLEHMRALPQSELECHARTAYSPDDQEGNWKVKIMIFVFCCYMRTTVQYLNQKLKIGN